MEMEAKEKLGNFKVGNLPTLFYIPDFITDTDQTFLLNNIYGAPTSKWKLLKNRRLQNWGGVVHEKGLLPQVLPPWLTRFTQKISEESGLFPSPINHVLINEYLPNQGIMPHQDGPSYFPVVAILSLGSPVIMDFTPHARLKLDSQEVIDKDSKGGTVEIGKDKWLDGDHPFSVILMPRSLLIFKDNAYSDYLHGIKDCVVHYYDGAVNETEALKHKQSDSHLFGSKDAEETIGKEGHENISRTSNRISLTCRLVPKVHKNLFRYLNGTATHGMVLQPVAQDNKFFLRAYSDSDWASGLDDRRSTFASCIFFGLNLVAWSLKKQPLVVKSSAEAEYRVMAHTTSELLWIESLLSKLHVPFHPPTLLCDNLSVVMLAHNHIIHAHAKHIELDIHFVREKVVAKTLMVQHEPASAQIADALTKSLHTTQFQDLRVKLQAVSQLP